MDPSPINLHYGSSEPSILHSPNHWLISEILQTKLWMNYHTELKDRRKVKYNKGVYQSLAKIYLDCIILESSIYCGLRVM